MAAAVGFSGDDLDDIEVAVSEAVTNAIMHGTPKGKAGSVKIRCRDTVNSLSIEVEDEGNGQAFQPKEIIDPERENGRGILMIAALMDIAQTISDESGTIVRMTKHKRKHENRC